MGKKKGLKVRAARAIMREAAPYYPTDDEIEAAKTPAGAWTAAQLAQWGVAWPPQHGWRKRLEAARLRQLAGLPVEAAHHAHAGYDAWYRIQEGG